MGVPGERAPTRIHRTASCAAAFANTSRRLRARSWPHASRTGRPARQAAAPATAAARITTPTNRCRLARVGKRQHAVMARRRRASAMRAGRASAVAFELVAGRSSSSSRPSPQGESNDEPSAHRHTTRSLQRCRMSRLRTVTQQGACRGCVCAPLYGCGAIEASVCWSHGGWFSQPGLSSAQDAFPSSHDASTTGAAGAQGAAVGGQLRVSHNGH